MPLTVGVMKREDTALAAVLTFMSRRPPFETMRLGEVFGTVAAAIRRGHYGVAAEDGRIRGVLLWALTDAATARRWAGGGVAPSFEEASAGDTLVVLLGAADDPRVPGRGFREMARRHPGLLYVMKRHGRPGLKRGRLPGRPVTSTAV